MVQFELEPSSNAPGRGNFQTLKATSKAMLNFTLPKAGNNLHYISTCNKTLHNGKLKSWSTMCIRFNKSSSKSVLSPDDMHIITMLELKSEPQTKGLNLGGVTISNAKNNKIPPKREMRGFSMTVRRPIVFYLTQFR